MLRLLPLLLLLPTPSTPTSTTTTTEPFLAVSPSGDLLVTSAAGVSITSTELTWNGEAVAAASDVELATARGYCSGLFSVQSNPPAGHVFHVQVSARRCGPSGGTPTLTCNQLCASSTGGINSCIGSLYVRSTPTTYIYPYPLTTGCAWEGASCGPTYCCCSNSKAAAYTTAARLAQLEANKMDNRRFGLTLDFAPPAAADTLSFLHVAAPNSSQNAALAVIPALTSFTFATWRYRDSSADGSGALVSYSLPYSNNALSLKINSERSPSGLANARSPVLNLGINGYVAAEVSIANSTAALFEASGWLHLAVTWSAADNTAPSADTPSKARVFVNGALAGEAVGPASSLEWATAIPGNGDWIIGLDADGPLASSPAFEPSEAFVGSLSDYHVFDTALPPGAISALACGRFTDPGNVLSWQHVEQRLHAYAQAFPDAPVISRQYRDLAPNAC